MVYYSSYTSRVRVISKIDIIKKDPTDNIFLACAKDGKADYIVSGDHHLLDLKIFLQTLIVSPKEFLRLEKIK